MNKKALELFLVVILVFTLVLSGCSDGSSSVNVSGQNTESSGNVSSGPEQAAEGANWEQAVW